jgi:hypothetical protein
MQLTPLQEAGSDIVLNKKYYGMVLAHGSAKVARQDFIKDALGRCSLKGL